MAAYVIVGVTVHNPEAYQEYTSQVLATVEAHGGRFVVRGGRYETIEGEWSPGRVVVLEFPSYEAAKAWHASPAYRAILPIRERNADTQFLTVVEGV